MSSTDLPALGRGVHRPYCVSRNVNTLLHSVEEIGHSAGMSAPALRPEVTTTVARSMMRARMMMQMMMMRMLQRQPSL